MGLQVEEIVEGADPMVDILMPEGPSMVALPLIKTIRDNTAAIWLTPASLAPMAKAFRGNTLSPQRVMNIFIPTHHQDRS